MGCPKKNIPHDAGCAPGCPPECLLAVAKSEEAASASATAAAKSAALAQELLKNCLSDSTIAEGGGLVYTEGEGISVNPADIIEENGGLAVSDNNKLLVDFSNMSATDLGNLIKQLIAAGGGLAINSNGQMYVDFSSMSSTQLNTLITEIVQEGGGLSVDENGQIYVDFDSMPTDKFEAMLKSIRVPIWLSANKNFYVNGETGSDDTSIEGIGESASKPFKTIQACVDYVTDNYNISSYTPVISIAAGSYEEQVTLGDFSRTTGSIYLRPASGSDSVTVKQTNRTVMVARGGAWNVCGLNIDMTVTAEQANSTGNAVYYRCIMSDGAGTTVNMSNLNLYAHFDGDAATNGSVTVAVAYTTNEGAIKFDANNTSYQDSRIQCECTNANSVTCILMDTGSVTTATSNTSADMLITHVSGAANYFIRGSNASFSRATGAKYAYQFVVDDGDTFTGIRYYAGAGSTINVNGAGAEYFPGDTAGSVETSTYSWYK